MAYGNKEEIETNQAFDLMNKGTMSGADMLKNSNLNKGYYNDVITALGLKVGSGGRIGFGFEESTSHISDNFKFLEDLGANNLESLELLRGNRGFDKPSGLSLLQRFEGTQEWDALPKNVKIKLNDFINHVELTSGIVNVKRNDGDLQNYIDQNVTINTLTGEKFADPKDRALPKSKGNSFVEMATRAGDSEAIEWMNNFINDISENLGER
tara:strand:+ start:333 stop:965 length:633 start_codon:yes stop_codon:yes gene_type:complete